VLLRYVPRYIDKPLPRQSRSDPQDLDE